LLFAGKNSLDIDVRFERVGDVPLLQDCSARIAARVDAEYECGDHTLFVGAILFMDSNDRPPLVYHGGAFGALPPKIVDALEWIEVEEMWGY
jgi:flavin reductase (DIM6/NTAB) family NADH-FMN oxidoreductase RutF